MVHLINAEQSGVADTIAHPSVAHLRPEGFVANRLGRAQADMTEASNTGVACTVIPAAADRRSPGNLDAIAARIGESDEVAHHARVGLLALPIWTAWPSFSSSA